MWNTEKFCSRVFDTPENELTKPYGAWMRAPFKRKRNLIGERWLREGNGGNERNPVAGGAMSSNVDEDFAAKNQKFDIMKNAIRKGITIVENKKKRNRRWAGSKKWGK